MATALIGPLISAGTSLLGGLLGSNGASKAAQQASATDKAVAQGLQNLGQSGFDASQAQIQPYLDAGNTGAQNLNKDISAGGSLTQQFAFDPSQIASTPEYQFQLQQGNDAVQASAAAKGGLFSGNTLRGLTQYSQGLASTSYQQAYNNALNTFQTNRNNTLGTDLAATGVGQTAVGQYQSALGQRLQANEAAVQPYEASGAALAAGTAGSSNAWTSALNGVSNAAQQYLGMTGIGGGTQSAGPSGELPGVPSLANPYPSVINTPLPTAPPVTPVATSTSQVGMPQQSTVQAPNPYSWASSNWIGATPPFLPGAIPGVQQ